MDKTLKINVKYGSASERDIGNGRGRGFFQAIIMTRVHSAEGRSSSLFLITRIHSAHDRERPPIFHFRVQSRSASDMDQNGSIFFMGIYFHRGFIFKGWGWWFDEMDKTEFIFKRGRWRYDEMETLTKKIFRVGKRHRKWSRQSLLPGDHHDPSTFCWGSK